MWMTMNWKWFGRKRLWRVLRYYRGIRLQGLKKNTRNLSRDSRLLGPRSEAGTSRIRSRNINHSTTTFGAPWNEWVRISVLYQRAKLMVLTVAIRSRIFMFRIFIGVFQFNARWWAYYLRCYFCNIHSTHDTVIPQVFCKVWRGFY
jgi:hypothetical protein